MLVGKGKGRWGGQGVKSEEEKESSVTPNQWCGLSFILLSAGAVDVGGNGDDSFMLVTALVVHNLKMP